MRWRADEFRGRWWGSMCPRPPAAGARADLLGVDGPPGRAAHVTPLLTVWLEGSLYFCTGADEGRAKNLAHNPQCAFTTGGDALDEGLDVVVEGEAVRVDDEPLLHRVADAYEQKYGTDWRFEVRDGAFFSDAGGPALVFLVNPTRAFAFAKGGYAQTR